MKSYITLVFALLFPVAALATETTQAENLSEPVSEETALDPDQTLLFLDARETDIRDFIWTRRLIVVMADTPENPQFIRQIEALREREMDFVARDAVVVFDAHPDDRSPLRQVMRPRGFMTAIIDKDGEVKARRPAFRSARELTAVIDRFPTRRQEILERAPAGR